MGPRTPEPPPEPGFEPPNPAPYYEKKRCKKQRFCFFLFWDPFGPIWAQGPWAHMGQGPWAHGPGPILKIFDFLDFLGLSAQYVFLNFWISDGPFCPKTPHLKCSHMDPLIITSSLKSVKFIDFYRRDSVFP